jgi:hypothetical protein
MPQIRSGLIDHPNGRYVILEEDGAFWAAEIVDIGVIPTSENYADVAEDLAAYQRSLCSSKSKPEAITPHSASASSD